MPSVLWPLLTTLSVAKPALCLLIAERHALVSHHTGIARRVLPVGDWLELVSGEVLCLMLDGSVKLAIISTA